MFPTESESNTVFPETLASKVNLIFKIRKLLSSVIVVFQYLVFCLSKYETFLLLLSLLENMLTIGSACGTIFEHTIVVSYSPFFREITKVTRQLYTEKSIIYI